jgi:hypothetical protein
LIAQDPWRFLIRLGEAQVLLPVIAVLAVSLALRPATRRTAWVWLGTFVFATAVTAASKIAFLGWGLGSAALDFTGASGHATLAAGVLPLGGALLSPRRDARSVAAGFALGATLATLVGLALLAVHAHSPAEIIAGFALGTAAATAALRTGGLPAARIHWAAAGAAVACLAFVPVTQPRLINTHAAVRYVALELSGRTKPWTRRMLHQDAARHAQARGQRAAHDSSGTCAPLHT